MNTFFLEPGVDKHVWVEIRAHTLLSGFSFWSKDRKYSERRSIFLCDEKLRKKDRGALEISLRTYTVIIK